MPSGNSEARKRNEAEARRLLGREIIPKPEMEKLVERGSLLHALTHLRAAVVEVEKILQHAARAQRPPRGEDSHQVYGADSTLHLAGISDVQDADIRAEAMRFTQAFSDGLRGL